MKQLILAGCIAAALPGAVSTVQAETIFGLSTANSLFSFDSATPGSISSVIGITGISSDTIIDIDFSPVNFSLYGIAATGNLYRINTSTGLATLSIGVGSQLPTANTINAPTAMDFNPAADRLRVFQGSNNFRITPDASAADGGATAPGTVSNDGTFTGAALPVDLVAAAYTNNVNNTASTALYSLDTLSDRLILHSVGPAFSTVASVGPLGTAIGATNIGFDVSFLQGSTTGYVSDGDAFYTIALGTGTLTPVGTIGNGGLTTKSIAAAAVPEPTTAALAAFGLLGFMARRRRVA